MFRRVTVGGLLLCVATALLPASTVASASEQERVVSIATAQLSKPFRLGAEGPRRFDCSGLIYFTFKNAGLYERFGTRRLLARNYYTWGRERGLLGTTNPRVGDLVLWTHSGTIVHMGMYIGVDNRGRARALSALTTGVSRHSIGGISVRFLTYVHVGLDGTPDPDPSPSGSPPPTVSPSATPVEPGATPSLAPTPLPTPTL
ncbi:MAG TPA: NlpC/P60 family protein [Candidatus Limnocylindrales bacterium]|nr:NlpC/P60 family protein [Candidatus Limnocylindrales bacterium]